jgi:hypothetical protein
MPSYLLSHFVHISSHAWVPSAASHTAGGSPGQPQPPPLPVDPALERYPLLVRRRAGPQPGAAACWAGLLVPQQCARQPARCSLLRRSVAGPRRLASGASNHAT